MERIPPPRKVTAKQLRTSDPVSAEICHGSVAAPPCDEHGENHLEVGRIGTAPLRPLSLP
jgi:hypothetical protein